MRNFRYYLIRIVFLAICASPWLIVAKMTQERARKNCQKTDCLACCINCQDPRIQETFNSYITKNYHINRLEPITEAGPNKILAQTKPDEEQRIINKRLRERIHISIYHHKAEMIFVGAHADCLGNPATKDEQINDLKKAKSNLETENPGVIVIALWIEDDFKTVVKIE